MDVGFGEMLMLAVLALLIFGPERLPGIARTVGRTIGQIRREATSTFDALRSEVELDELQQFNADLQREREELRARSRLDSGPLARRTGQSPRHRETEAGHARFDPHAT